ncbi:MAG TPA: efflux RND transporter periplasmic adaptor subunit, partial [Ktedonobacteraceae bacterium]
MKKPSSKSLGVKRLRTRKSAIETASPQEMHDTSSVPEERQAQAQMNQVEVEDEEASFSLRSPMPRWSRPGRRSIFVLSTAIGMLVLLGVGLFAWSYVIRPMMVPDVTLYTVKSEVAPVTIGGSGILYPLQQYDVTYPNSEFVVAVNVKAGDKVKRGQSLVQLDPGLLSTQIKQASDDLSAAQAYLYSVQASGSAVSIAQAQQQFNVAQSKYNALLNQASTLHNGNLTSTMDGIVTTVNVSPGQVATTNSILLTVMDESTVIVRTKVPLADLGQVQVGQSATVSPSALPGLSFPGKVTAVIPQADPQTDTFEAWVSVINAGTQLLPGMSAFSHIQS